MERHNRPPPDDFPRLWGVEDKLGLYMEERKKFQTAEPVTGRVLFADYIEQ